MVAADKIIGSISLEYSNLVVDVGPGEFGLTVDLLVYGCGTVGPGAD